MIRATQVLAVSLASSLCGMLAAQEGTTKPAPAPTQPAAAARLIAAPQQQGEPTQAELQKKYDEKLAKPFVEKSKWTTDYDAARARAKEEHKLLFTYFTRSYAY
ncbi:MAG: hypothetical protein U1F36_00890 [Planctomycetota bacterium]